MAVTRICAREGCDKEFAARGNQKYCSKMCALTVKLERSRRYVDKRRVGKRGPE